MQSCLQFMQPCVSKFQRMIGLFPPRSCMLTTSSTENYRSFCGVGSGLGNQNGKVNKASISPFKAAKTKTPCAESRDWGVNARDEKGRTALHFASRMISADFAHLLLDAGADIHAHDKDGYTPLHMAASYSRCDCVKLLLEHGKLTKFRLIWLALGLVMYREFTNLGHEFHVIQGCCNRLTESLLANDVSLNYFACC